MKTKKKMSKLQKNTCERNWNKGLLVGMKTNIDKIRTAKTTPLGDRLLLSMILHNLDKLLENWNK